ncbi:MAG: FtsQ-type POTRA domain-containing protein [Elioraea sp.]|nr:FtsQ-type POTRA domain-containing protein [Elioraea sp.]
MRRLNHRSAAQRPGRIRLMLRRWRRLARPAALLGLSALVLVAFAAGLVLSGAPQRLFAEMMRTLEDAAAEAGLVVSTVTVEGRVHEDRDAILAASGLRLGQPMLSVSPQAVRRRLEELPWVEQASVYRRLPGHVHLAIVERAPFAVWQNRGTFVVIDRQGRVITRDGVARFAHLPHVVGEGAAEAAAAFLDLLDRYPEVRQRVAAAVRVNQRRWNLRLVSGADVLLPEGHEAAALARLEELHRDGAVLDRALRVVDLRLADRLVLRPAADSQPAPVPPSQERGRRG